MPTSPHLGTPWRTLRAAFCAPGSYALRPTVTPRYCAPRCNSRWVPGRRRSHPVRYHGWKPSNYPNCTFKAGSKDDCYLDVLADFAAVQMPGGGTFPINKIVMGLMIGPADDGTVITPHDAAVYAKFVRANDYGGIMIWDVDRDGPTTTGHPKGTYIGTIGDHLEL